MLQQGLGPTGQHFTLQIELLELDLAPFRKNLELTDAKLKALKKAGADDFEDASEDDLRVNRDKLAKEVLAREVDIPAAAGRPLPERPGPPPRTGGEAA